MILKLMFVFFMLLLSVGTVAHAAVINVPGTYQTIQEGVDAATDGDTVLVEPGLYTETVYVINKSVVIGSLFLTTGDATYAEQTIIRGNSDAFTLLFENDTESPNGVYGLTITFNGCDTCESPNIGAGIVCKNASPRIDHNFITGNTSDKWQSGGGIYLENSSAVITANRISNNNPGRNNGVGAGILCIDSQPRIIGNTIDSNHFQSLNYAAGVYCNNSTAYIYQNIITDNSGESVDNGGGIICIGGESLIGFNIIYSNVFDGLQGGIYSINAFINARNNTIVKNPYGIRCKDTSQVTVINTILWKNTQGEVVVEPGSIFVVNHSLIQNGWDGVEILNTDPLFRNFANNNFALTSDSPCIDAGNIDSDGDGITWVVDVDDQDDDESRPDIGALAFDRRVSATPGERVRYASSMLRANFPNPFVETTTITFLLPVPETITIAIYDAQGVLVATLADMISYAEGEHTIRWNGFDMTGRELPAGVYYCRLQTQNVSEANRMVLMR